MTMNNGFVHIIESPNDKDLLTGRTEGKTLCEALSLSGVPHCYNLVTTPETLVDALQSRLIDALAKFNGRPIIHLSMHGNNEGVALTNGLFLKWEDLRKLLTPLTNAMDGTLLICMSSCFGSAGCRMVMHEDADKPFWALVGNSGEVNWSDATVAYITFYHLFFKTFPIEECVNRMILASGDSGFTVLFGYETKRNWEQYAANERNLLAEAIRAYSAKKGGLLGELLPSHD
ncbi:hypothetical protein ACO0LF_25155 [Undibacterium sp. Di27W]|uniref:hypothetical protein n=1 Tax=Undibacterium sp. Di27W TaxID=3413036 RepID=UPI003BF2A819